VYDAQEDHYICPENHFLKTNGNFYINHRGKSNQSEFKQYKTKACNGCPVRELCTTAKNGRLLARNIYTPVYEENKRNMEADPELYLRRQAIVEHPFGTIKRQWGFDHILSKKGKKRASADVGFIFIAYNLKRILSLMGKKGFREMYAQLILCLSVLIQAYKAIFRTLYSNDTINPNFSPTPNPTVKKLILAHNWQ
jgi:hypothetical protein